MGLLGNGVFEIGLVLGLRVKCFDSWVSLISVDCLFIVSNWCVFLGLVLRWYMRVVDFFGKRCMMLVLIVGGISCMNVFFFFW